jgi:rSAM/selenodomain-associated transferase 1
MSSRGATRTGAEPALIVFARAPEPGRVKTRLAPLLGERGAARLYAQMVEKTLRTAFAARFGRVDLYCASGMKSPYFKKIQKRFDVRLCAQGRGNLGERMYRALRRHPGAVLIGSDCPVLRPADLRAAARALRSGADAVLAPAEDGGYALIGLRRASRAVFDGIDWGGPKVLEQTCVRLRRLGWRWKELRTVWDVDRPEDVARLRRSGLLSGLLPTARPPSAAARKRARPSGGSRGRSGVSGRI